MPKKNTATKLAPSSKVVSFPTGFLRVGFLIHDVSRLRRTIYDQRLKPLQVTRSQWWVLTHLTRHEMDEGYAQTELARLLDVGKVTLGGLIDRLEQGGFVRRVPDKTDRRAKRVLVTEKGLELIHVMEDVAKSVNAEIMAGISSREERMLSDVLHRMKDNLIKMEAVPGSGNGRKQAETK